MEFTDLNSHEDDINQYLDGWEQVFESILELLDDYEQNRYTFSIDVRENILTRMESVIVVIQQVLSVSAVRHLECAPFLEELLRNIRALYLDWTRYGTDSRCTNVAIYSLQCPPVIRTVTPGRPRLDIREDVLIQLRSFGFTWKNISQMLLVSRWTIRRRVIEYGIQEITGYSNISDEELDIIVREFSGQHGSLVGCSIVNGHLRSLGLRLQRQRVRESLARVDPTNTHIRWAIVVSRRAYSVPGPNSLWHIDGHHSLITWGFVIHGGIDGFSRLIVFLKCSTNNRCETVEQCFVSAVEQYQWPSRIRTDHGGENTRVWQLMEERRGANRGSYIAGTSVHNQRIERLWRDVFCVVCHMFYYTFQAMEESGILHRDNRLHMFVLHLIYTPRINRALESFVSAWNQHTMRTERNWSPLRMWTNGMLDIRNHQLSAVANVADSETGFDDLEWFGFDPYAPTPDDEGLTTVVVDDVNIDVEDHILNQLINNTNPLQNSDSFGIDLYQDALSFLLNAGIE